MEKVPPWTSSGLSWREWARAARSTMARCKPTTVPPPRAEQAKVRVEPMSVMRAGHALFVFGVE